MKVLVVGSGPAGVSCAQALLDRGEQVWMLDSGLELEPSAQQTLAELKRQGVSQWDPRAIASFTDATEARPDGVPLKRAYGSDFPYRPARASERPTRRRNADCVASFARGGLSNVWGAAILPYRDADLAGWPISVKDLEPHYRAVLATMPHSARADSLEAILPTYSAHTRPPLRPTRQASALLASLQRGSARLAADGIHFGQARLAVASSDCLYCGLCMYGCPHSLIFNSAQVLPELERHPNFTYRGGVTVERIEERPDGVVVAHAWSEGKPVAFEGARVFLACGTLSSSRILLESLGAYDRELRVRDSQYFLFPVLSFKGTRGVQKEALHTLSQLFVEILDPTISDQTIHLQYYSFNDLYVRAFKSLLKGAYRLVNPVLDPLLSRLWIVQGYLHSDLSPSIRLRLTKDAASRDGKTTFHVTGDARGSARAVSRRAIRQVLRKLRCHARAFGGLPLPAMLRPGKPGQGYHFGGSFPMSATPGEFESDRLGRPTGFARVHLVDSSTFPTIPATTITLTVMANAHRIGTHYDSPPPG